MASNPFFITLQAVLGSSVGKCGLGNGFNCHLLYLHIIFFSLLRIKNSILKKSPLNDGYIPCIIL
jgi:hypothetical protein